MKESIDQEILQNWEHPGRVAAKYALQPAMIHNRKQTLRRRHLVYETSKRGSESVEKVALASIESINSVIKNALGTAVEAANTSIKNTLKTVATFNGETIDKGKFLFISFVSYNSRIMHI